MIETLQLEEQTFTDLDELMEHLTVQEEQTMRRMVRIQDISLEESGVRIGDRTYPIKEHAFKQLSKITSMDWGSSYFKNAPTDLIISDFERMKHLNPELQCRMVIKNGQIISVLPQDLIVAPYDQVVTCLELEEIEEATVGDNGLRITLTQDDSINVNPEIGDIFKVGRDFMYSNTNWSKMARVSPYLLRLLCTNGVTAIENSVFKSFSAYVPKSGDLQHFYTKLREGQHETSFDVDRFKQSVDIMRTHKLRDLSDNDRIVANTRYWLSKEVFDQNPNLNVVHEDKVIPNLDVQIYDFFNEITNMARQVPMVRKRKVEEIAGSIIDKSLDIPLRQL